MVVVAAAVIVVVLEVVVAAERWLENIVMKRRGAGVSLST